MPIQPSATPPKPEAKHLLTIKAAAKALGVRYWLLLHAVNNGDIPYYRLGNSRRRVRLCDIENAMAAAGRPAVSPQ